MLPTSLPELPKLSRTLGKSQKTKFRTRILREKFGKKSLLALYSPFCSYFYLRNFFHLRSRGCFVTVYRMRGPRGKMAEVHLPHSTAQGHQREDQAGSEEHLQQPGVVATPHGVLPRDSH